MSYDEMMRNASTVSDHGARVNEFEPGMIEGLKTGPENAFLEIGNWKGGSAWLALWHLWKEEKNRMFVGVDFMKEAWFRDYLRVVPELVAQYNLPFVQFYMDSKVFCERYAKAWKFGYILLDASHTHEDVIRDVGYLSQALCQGGVLVIDDAQESRPGDLSEFGLERLYLLTSDLFNYTGADSKHVVFWRKT